ncbi:MAG: hypothetical protein E7554_03675 [Ruminococcaceae bacterium]|nr:hypothetical protein [Oscillospiraceae bacterium]
MRKDAKKTAAAEQPSAMSVFMGSEPRLEIRGTRELLIEGSTGVIYYSDTAMRIGVGGRTLLLIGSELSISIMFGSTLTVVGQIKSVEFV